MEGLGLEMARLSQMKGKHQKRIRELEALRIEMRENTGEEVDGRTLAEVFFPTMDVSCQSEIVALKVKIGTGDSARVQFGITAGQPADVAILRRPLVGERREGDVAQLLV